MNFNYNYNKMNTNCQYGYKGFPECHCNICINKILEFQGFKKNDIYLYDNKFRVKIIAFIPLENCKEFLIRGINNNNFMT